MGKWKPRFLHILSTENVKCLSKRAIWSLLWTYMWVFYLILCHEITGPRILHKILFPANNSKSFRSKHCLNPQVCVCVFSYWWLHQKLDTLFCFSMLPIEKPSCAWKSKTWKDLRITYLRQFFQNYCIIQACFSQAIFESFGKLHSPGNVWPVSCMW